jgi:hypothetical protein
MKKTAAIKKSFPAFRQGRTCIILFRLLSITSALQVSDNIYIEFFRIIAGSRKRKEADRSKVIYTTGPP